ncbi:MAG TPA: CU044_2847 family protein [Bryobacteraceae bacterium]|jgi:hypothetical protein|nr:CU044_2847 family protein [Bryobacteraceae bacterium]
MAYVGYRLSEDDNTVAVIETADAPATEGPRPASIQTLFSGRVSVLPGTLESSLDSVHKAAGIVMKKMLAMVPERPDRLEIELGLKCSAELDAWVLASIDGEVHLKLKLSWQKPGEGRPGDHG